MIFLLDTDTVSHIVRKHPPIIKKLIKHENDEICISAITYAELFYGLEKKGSEKLFNEMRSIIGKCSIIDFDTSQAELYGRIRSELEKSGTPLGDMDMLIAAAALSTGAILVSHNTRHFSKIKGIKVEDWCYID
ncbi:MAG: type II toxin-antitoxin system VapC family toxin [Treponema sp.]|jgi:tRNA(fMet)-specific endonuclease VapC|nr:type II toxin-antitoxin system VapC family toxin [Treponema sp.]